MRTPRLVAALVLSFSGVIGASACVQEPDISPETSQTTLEADTDEATATATDELGEFDPGSIGGSDFGHLKLGGGLNLSGPGPSSSVHDPTLLAQCLQLAGAGMPAKEAFCNSLPDNGMRGRCWKNRYSRVGWTGWCFFEFTD